ncbi:MAG: hypothetical protein OEV73_00510 [Desulfobulbaceae bacterium]|nr:hypothetical protein [Desulfobulbaceae bacterium]
MKSIGLSRKRFIRQGAQQAVAARRETFCAVVWDVYPAQRYCRCKIQGSDTYVVAHYPENWTATPEYLKPANGVILERVGGMQGRLIVKSHGVIRPISPTGASAPALATPPDCVLTGLLVTEIPAQLQMAVFVRTGTIRIGGTTYTVDAIAMSDTTLLTMAMEAPIEETAAVLAIGAAPAVGQWRYDLVSVGADLAIHVTAGTASSSPVMPDLPAGHVKCGHVLVTGGMTEVTSSAIDVWWVAPAPSLLTVAIADDDLAWGELSTTVTVAVEDQYGHSILQSGNGWYVTLAIATGNGTISWGSSSGTSVEGYSGAASNQVVFTYTRDGLDPGDVSPTFSITMDYLTAYGNIILRDVGGDIMT